MSSPLMDPSSHPDKVCYCSPHREKNISQESFVQIQGQKQTNKQTPPHQSTHEHSTRCLVPSSDSSPHSCHFFSSSKEINSDSCGNQVFRLPPKTTTTTTKTNNNKTTTSPQKNPKTTTTTKNKQTKNPKTNQNQTKSKQTNKQNTTLQSTREHHASTNRYSAIHAALHLVRNFLAVLLVVVKVGLLVGGPGGEGGGDETEEGTHQGQGEAGSQRHHLARVLSQFSVLAHNEQRRQQPEKT